MNTQNRLLAVIVVSLAVASSFAQGGGGGQRRGGGRNPNAISSLIRRMDVQKDLGMTADEISKIADVPAPARGGGGNRGGGGGGGTPPDPAAMEAAQAARDKPFLDILTPDQQTRIKQIQIQLEGDSAVLHPDIQTAIGLTDDQKSQIKDLQAKAGEANRAAREKMTNQEIDQTQFRAAMATNQQAVKDGIHKLLTDAQLSKLKDLGGKPFVADPPAGGGR